MTKETDKAIKMFFRTVIIAILPVLISSLENGVPWREALTALAIAFLMAANTYINASDSFDTKGILPLT